MHKRPTYLFMGAVSVLAVCLACAATRADFKLVENWDTMPTGSPQGLACTGVLGGRWDCEVSATGNVVVEDNSGSRVCRVANLSAGGARAFGFNNINSPIAPGGAGKVFFRFMVRVDSLVPRAYVGLISDTGNDPINGTNANGQTGFCVGFGIVSDGGTGYNLVKTDGTTILKTGLTKGRWYNAWIIVDHSAETFDLYSSEASGPAGDATLPNAEDLLGAGIPFGAANTEPLNGMIFTSPTATPQASRTFIDEIYWDGEQGLTPTSKAKGCKPGTGESDIPRDVVLGWTAGPSAVSHDVYFGTSQADADAADRANPKGVLVSQGQAGTSFDPIGLLAFNQAYYWRVDEVDAASTIVKGSVWGFTTEPYSYRLRTSIQATASSFQTGFGPEKTTDGSGMNASDQHSATAADTWLTAAKGASLPAWIQYQFDDVYVLDQMWVWNSNQPVESAVGLGAKDVGIEYSIDGTTWTALAGVPEFAQASGAADYVYNTIVRFNGAQAKYVKLTINANWGGLPQTGLSEVRFFYVPVKAFGASPASAAANVALDAVLNWRPGRQAVRHEVYLGTDPNAVLKGGSPVKTLSAHSLSLADLKLEYGRTYYWKVNEVNDAASPKTREGDLWSFSTVAYAVIDDFESYDDTCNRIFFAWVDGFGHSGSADCSVPASGGNNTGSTVGNINPPFAERTIVNSGRQSMPMNYDNTKSPFYSETQRQWSTAQAWTGGGANTLTVYFRGEPAAFLETAPGSIVMSGMGTDIYNASDQGRFAYKSLTGDGAIVARVDGLANTNAWAKAGVMIREALTEGSSWAYVLYGGTNGVHYQARLTAGVAATSDTSLTNLPPDQTGARAPVWVKVERKGNLFNGYYATDAAGTAWKAMAWNPQTITMASNVYIGLAVTSHAANVVCGARFTSVSTTGNVSGAWQTVSMGVAQPATGNSPETFYVALQDSANRMKVVSHTQPTVMATGEWIQWDVPLSEFTSAGVDLGSIKKMILGVGNRTSPSAGSTGKVFIDDVRLTRTGQ